MTFEQKWIEYDYNPFIIFHSNGKIASLNAEAQFLLGHASAHELFELATSYASVSFGFKTTFLELNFGRYKFFGLTVGYENEDEIGIKFYQSPTFQMEKPTLQGELTNIYTLIDLCISTNSINSSVKYLKEFDPTIPDIIINSNAFIKLLNKSYMCFSENDSIKTKVFLRIGEYIKFDSKKCSIFSIEISSQNIDVIKAREVKNFAQNNNFYVDIKKKITINIPMLTS